MHLDRLLPPHYRRWHRHWPVLLPSVAIFSGQPLHFTGFSHTSLPSHLPSTSHCPCMLPWLPVACCHLSCHKPAPPATFFKPYPFHYPDPTSPSLSHGFSVRSEPTRHAALVAYSGRHLSAVGRIPTSPAVLGLLPSSSTSSDPVPLLGTTNNHLGWLTGRSSTPCCSATVGDRHCLWPSTHQPSPLSPRPTSIEVEPGLLL